MAAESGLFGYFVSQFSVLDNLAVPAAVLFHEVELAFQIIPPGNVVIFADFAVFLVLASVVLVVLDTVLLVLDVSNFTFVLDV